MPKQPAGETGRRRKKATCPSREHFIPFRAIKSSPSALCKQSTAPPRTRHKVFVSGVTKKKTTMKTLHLVALHPEITPFWSLGFKWVYTSERFIRPRHGTAKQQQLTTAHLPPPPPTIIRRLERDGGGKSLTQTLRPPSHGDEMMDDFRDDATAGCSRRTPARIQSRICSEKWSKERQCRGIGDGADGCGRIA